jgi:hypothetical protein
MCGSAIPSARRHFYARQFVEPALHRLALRQCLPRYQVHTDNHASIRRVVTIEQWLTT